MREPASLNERGARNLHTRQSATTKAKLAKNAGVTLAPKEVAAQRVSKRRNQQRQEGPQSTHTSDVKEAGCTSALQEPQPPREEWATLAELNQTRDAGCFDVFLGRDLDVPTRRFKVLWLLFDGRHAKIVEAWDRKHRQYCTVKIYNNRYSLQEFVSTEICVLENLRLADPDANFPLPRYLGAFWTANAHHCVITSRYGVHGEDWIARVGGSASLRQLAQISFFVSKALYLLHTQLHIIHTNVSPKAIVFRTLTAAEVNKKTFAEVAQHHEAAVMLNNFMYSVPRREGTDRWEIGKLPYRSPEALLDLPFGPPHDLWSLGCTLYEFAKGRCLFEPMSQLEHLLAMENVTLSSLPETIRGEKCSRAPFEFVPASLGELVRRKYPRSPAHSLVPIAYQFSDTNFSQLILRLLQFAPEQRLTPWDVMTHPFVLANFPESATQLPEARSVGHKVLDALSSLSEEAGGR